MELDHIFERYNLTPEEFDAFADFFSFRQCQPGEAVFQEGAAADKFYFVRSGELAASRLSADRQENIISVFGPGDCFGEIGLLYEVPRTAKVEALTHAQLYELDKASFHALRATSTSFATFLEELHIHRMLKDVALFHELDDESLGHIRREIVHRDVKQDGVLIHEGDNADTLYILVQGSARMFRSGVDGRETTVARLHPGAHFGQQGLLTRTRHGEAVALKAPGRLLALEAARFRRLLRRYPSIGFKLPGRGLLNTILPFFTNKSAYLALPYLAMNRPRAVVQAIALVTLLLLVPAVLPSIWPAPFPFLHALKVDTDPENMLATDEPARRFHNRLKNEMTLHDMLVLGVVNEEHPNGVFNVASLTRIHQLTDYARTLRWPDDEHPDGMRGVISVDVMAPSTVDVIEQAGPGTVRFEWLMPEPPRSETEAQALLTTMRRFPMMDSILISHDGKALSLYLPLTSKDVSFKVYSALKERIAEMGGDDRYFITGLPVAEDAFGVEMFIQMAISAPLAMLVIFLLLLFFFRNVTLVVSPMLVAMVSVICTMALLVITGNTLHIMSSMIPIFIMPIAVLDSVHILSEFSDFYPRILDRRLTMEHVMRELFVPMLFTSLTTAVGFASLALVPIPPVQVFGVFVAVGVLLAWLLSISLIPAYVMLMPPHKLNALTSAGRRSADGGARGTLLSDLLRGIHRVTVQRTRVILLTTLAAVMLCVYGIQRIVVNDNPVRWFADDHPIRVADKVLNDHFAGTYMAFLALAAPEDAGAAKHLLDALNAHTAALVEDEPTHQTQAEVLRTEARRLAGGAHDVAALFDALEDVVLARIEAPDGADTAFWEDTLAFVENLRQSRQVFKDPGVLSYVEDLQRALLDTGIVGKSVSLVDIAKTVNRELRGGADADYRVPDSARGIAQTFLTYQNGHRPQDLWRFVTPDFRQASVWLLLNSGDNRDMTRVLRAAEHFMADHPPPGGLEPGWFGLTFINVVWQDKMVSGMLLAIAGSYLAVLLMMSILLRSARWGLLSMIPLSATMLVIFGVLGLAGKPYDMPVAVLSALTIGLAVDFTIHFLVRIRHFMSQTGSWQTALETMFAEPARAITRNILVVAIGFLPLLAAPLVPYNTVGTLIAVILFISGVATLLILSAVLNAFPNSFFPGGDTRRTTLFSCPDALFAGGVAGVLGLIALQPLFPWAWSSLPWFTLVFLAAVALAARACRRARPEFNHLDTRAPTGEGNP